MLGEHCCTWVFIQDDRFTLADSGGCRVFDRGRVVRNADGWRLVGQNGARVITANPGGGFRLDRPGKYLELAELDESTFEQAFHGRLRRPLDLSELRPKSSPGSGAGAMDVN